MRYLTTAAMALALAAGAAAAGADPQNNNQNTTTTTTTPSGRASGGQGGQGQHGGGQGGHGAQAGAQGTVQGAHAGQTFTTQGGATGGQQGTHGFNGQVTGGNQNHFHSQGNFNGQGNGQGNGQSGGAGAQNYRGYGRGPGGYVGPNGVQGGGQGNQFQGNANAHAFNGNVRGGVPGNGHQLRGRDQGRGWYQPGAVPDQFRAERRFHEDWNDRPHGWYARRWQFGEFLPFGWFAPDYYLDYQDYDLPDPPIGCEWVREGSDAVLVNVWTGEVLSVAYGVFW
ncbi:MAG TPA: RcnB family protein [Caulobacteraceae bacterium]|nr:RcnB family protein [Caulobacteraceae bacterium]